MATATLNQYQKRQFGGAAGAYGNVATLRYPLATNSSGGALDADSSAALAQNDIVDLGPLPEGLRLDDAQIIVTTAMTASVTGSLGFKYEDGVDDTAVPQDAAYFGSALVLNATGRVRAGGTKLVVLPKPARLILTITGAANAKVSALNVIVNGELHGDR